MRPVIGLLCVLLPGCAALSAKKHTYAGSATVTVNGADVSLGVKPEGTASGSFAVSAMVVSAGTATLDGPFRWRIKALGEAGKHQALVIHRLRTVTSATRRDEWFPEKHLGRRTEFRALKAEPGRTRAVFEIPGYLEVKPREDGALTIEADISVQSAGRWQRRLLKFRLDPTEKRQDEFIFLPVEIVRGIGSDPRDWEDPSWD